MIGIQRRTHQPETEDAANGCADACTPTPVSAIDHTEATDRSRRHNDDGRPAVGPHPDTVAAHVDGLPLQETARVRLEANPIAKPDVTETLGRQPHRKSQYNEDARGPQRHLVPPPFTWC